MIDLNAFVPPGSSFQQLTDAFNINDRGEIYGVGVPPGVSPQQVEALGHVFLLIPDGDRDGDCQSRIDQSRAEAELRRESTPVIRQGAEPPLRPIERIRDMMWQRYHLPGQPVASRE